MKRTSNRPLLRTLAVATLAAGAVLGPTTAAQAKTVYNTDRRGDVTAFTDTYDPSTDDETETSTPRPDQTDGDIVKTRLFHATAVGVWVSMADVRRARGIRGDLLRIVTNKGLEREVFLLAGPGDRQGTASMESDRGEVYCHITHKIDYDANMVKLRVPRRCLGNPKWVRLGVASVTSSADETTDTSQTYLVDDGLLDRPLTDPDADLRLSARLYQHK